MSAKSIMAWVVTGTVLMSTSFVSAQTATQSLGSVRITQRVVANGQPLAPGTYTVRLVDGPVAPVVGQSAESSRWVEFLQGTDVKGRELATVVAAADLKAVTEGAPPAPGSVRVQLLRGGEYLRVWLNRSGTHYLLHLSTGASAAAAAR